MTWSIARLSATAEPFVYDCWLFNLWTLFARLSVTSKLKLVLS